MSSTDDVLRNNELHVASFAGAITPARPAKRLAVVTCMDARLDVHEMLGLADGDAHVIRNAGGVVTDDVIRSLIVSQRVLGTDEVMLIHHTDCGMTRLDEDALKAEIERETGIVPSFTLGAFPDVDGEAMRSIERVSSNPFIARKSSIRGFVYDVETGRLREVRP